MRIETFERDKSSSFSGCAPLHRRPRHERQVLAHIRGEARSDTPEEDKAVDRMLILPFTQLRMLAQENDFLIQSADCRYVGTDEIQLLAWIARAQRYKSFKESFHADERLNRSIFLCAGLLTGLGTNLPPVTMMTRAGRPKASFTPQDE